jgi:hypothetical protein
MKKYNSLKAFYDQPKDGKKITKGQQQGKKGFTKNHISNGIKWADTNEVIDVKVTKSENSNIDYLYNAGVG